MLWYLLESSIAVAEAQTFLLAKCPKQREARRNCCIRRLQWDYQHKSPILRKSTSSFLNFSSLVCILNKIEPFKNTKKILRNVLTAGHFLNGDSELLYLVYYWLDKHKHYQGDSLNKR